MAGLFPCSWSQPLVRRQRQPKLLNAGYNLPVMPKPTRINLPTVIPQEELCPLVDDYELEQNIQQIQKEANCDYDPEKVMGMAREFNRKLDNTIEKLNTTPPKEQPVLDPPALLDLMVCVSHYSHILEGFVKKNNQSTNGISR